jgi:hypothetical protein
MNNGEAVSKVITSLRALSIDVRIPRRYVLKILRDTSKNLIAQKNLDRTIDLDTNLISEIIGLEFEKVDTITTNIITFKRCKTLMKSKKKLPELIFSRLGSSIREITSVDDNTRIKITSLEKYRRDQLRKYKVNNEVFAYIDSEGFVFIPDHEVLAVNVRLVTMNTEDVDEVNGVTNCKSGWDFNFTTPDKLEKTVFEETLRVIMGTYKQIRPDINPNGLENS